MKLSKSLLIVATTIIVAITSGCGTLSANKKPDLNWVLIQKEQAVTMELSQQVSYLQNQDSKLRNQLVYAQQQTAYAQMQAARAQKTISTNSTLVVTQTVTQSVTQVVTQTITKVSANIKVAPKSTCQKDDLSNNIKSIKTKIKDLQKDLEDKIGVVKKTYRRDVILQMRREIEADEIAIKSLELELQQTVVKFKKL